MKVVRLLFAFFVFSLTTLAVQADSVAIHLDHKALSRKVRSIDSDVLELAMNAYREAYKEGRVKKPYLVVIDYSKPSHKKRMWILDLNKNKSLYHLHVTHGINSGKVRPKKFSNKNGSLQTSLGVFVTENTYDGRNGYSLRLEGLDHGINHNAKRRGIVMHGAHYASEDFLEKNGELGRSWGCPAIDHEVNAEVIELLEHGSVVFSYYPDRKWLSKVDYAASALPTRDELNTQEG